MAINPTIFNAKVMHKRTLPRINQFTYGVYYLACPLDRLDELEDGWRFGLNRRGILSFHTKDHGERDGTDLREWAKARLAEYNMTEANGEIVLVAMPRVLGYVFNPVSFWLCFDRQQSLRAVICEVNNTFGETHSYLCAHNDHRPIEPDDWLEGDKAFHVSPFMHREGRYRFRFAWKYNLLGIWIDYDNADGDRQLLTSLTGALVPYGRKSRAHAFWSHPLVTFKTITLIHWQALKLVAKNIRYVPKPQQNLHRFTTTRNLTKK